MKSLLCSAARLTVVAGVVGCSTADLYPVTREPGLGGSAGGSGVGGTSNGGSPSAGKSGAPGGGVDGNAGNAGSASNCAARAARPGDSKHSVVVDGVTRSYLLHVPTAYDGSTPRPLVVDFHGIGESGMTERSMSPYPDTLDAEGVIMAFPDGMRGPAGTAWNVGPCCVEDVDDVAFARALVAHAQATACIDPRRIYAVGTLTGGGMAHYVGCHAADLFAAVAPAAFDLLEENVDGCEPLRPVTVISFRGLADTRVPYEGGPSMLVPGMPLTFLGAQGTFREWAAIAGCVGPASPADENGCAAYSGCAEGAEIILCTTAGGRDAPGDPNIAWPVLSRHQL